jgi:hypothetical protein
MFSSSYACDRKHNIFQPFLAFLSLGQCNAVLNMFLERPRSLLAMAGAAAATDLPRLYRPSRIRLWLESVREGVRDHIRLIVIERQLRRKFRAPLGEGEETKLRGPELHKPLRSCEGLEISELLAGGGAEQMRKQLSYAKRRNLRVHACKRV